MASLDTLLKTMRLEGEPAGGGGNGSDGLEEMDLSSACHFLSFLPSFWSRVPLGRRVQEPNRVNVELLDQNVAENVEKVQFSLLMTISEEHRVPIQSRCVAAV